MPEMRLPAVSVRNLAVSRGSRSIIQGLSFDLQYGEVLAVLGPNGVGKSTLLRGIAGLLPASGSIIVEGDSIFSFSARERARRLAFVPQRPSLQSPLPVHEVVAHGRFAHRRGFQRFLPGDANSVRLAMRQAKIEELAERPFTKLSQGEQQRVMLARGLCTGARILCLDEPTAALDVGHALAFYQLVRDLAEQGYAVLIVLHQLADALRFADRALLMSSSGPARLGPAADVVSAAPIEDVYGVGMRKNAGLEFDLLSGKPS